MIRDVGPLDVLLVEDNEGDARLTVEALREGQFVTNLKLVRDGEAAMDFLRSTRDSDGARRPDLILLDLNLPRKDGREVLAEIKGDPWLHIIPVVVLTTSDAEEDVARVYELHGNCYITKPIDLDQLIQVVQSIRNFWFSTVRLPQTG